MIIKLQWDWGLQFWGGGVVGLKNPLPEPFLRLRHWINAVWRSVVSGW